MSVGFVSYYTRAGVALSRSVLWRSRKHELVYREDMERDRDTVQC